MEKYPEFVRWAQNTQKNLKPFTKTQVAFINFLLEHEEETNKLGNLETPIELVRKYFKS